MSPASARAGDVDAVAEQGLELELGEIEHTYVLPPR